MTQNAPYSSHLLSITDVDIAYGESTAVKQATLLLERAQIGCLLGPSGCGKSTLLRSIAGFEPVRQGVIRVDGNVLSQPGRVVVPEKRGIGMVFQDIALFPHLTIADNIAFGLSSATRAEQQQRVQELLELIGLPGIEKRYPHSLSGGQQQRVALARALAPRPKLLLLDEPFSGLDATLKETLVPEIRRILVHEQITALVVTHDQLEAFAIADKIALMNTGHIEQFDTPYNIYHKPTTRFVADFIGQGYFIPATTMGANQLSTDLGVLSLPPQIKVSENGTYDLLIRPDDVLYDDDSPVHGEISDKQFKGTFFQYQVTLNNGRQLLCVASSHHNHDIGQKIGIRLDLNHFVMFPNQQP